MTVHVVAGPPCSGKSTHIAEHASPDAVVIDLDRIAQALGYPDDHIDWGDRVVHPARVAAMLARASLLKRAHTLGSEVWVSTSTLDLVHSLATRDVQVVELDPGAAECAARAKRDGRSDATLEQIRRWYRSDAVGQTSEQW